MTPIKTITLASLALGTALAVIPALRAQDRPAAPPTSGTMDHGAMMGGNTGGMMAMMGQMAQMMENCNRMMQNASNQPSRSPSPENVPATPGRNG